MEGGVPAEVGVSPERGQERAQIPGSEREYVDALPIDLELIPESSAERELNAKKDVVPKVTTYFAGGNEFVMAAQLPKKERGGVVENLIARAERLIEAIAVVFEGIGAVLRALLMKLLAGPQPATNPEAPAAAAGTGLSEGLQKLIDTLVGIAAVTVGVMLVAPFVAPLIAGAVSWIGGVIGGLLVLI